MTHNQRSALVVGAGVIGQVSAFALARVGWSVTIVDPSPGSGASFAAAGMLAPGGEVAPGEEENHRLHRAATDAWSDFVREVGQVAGRTIGLHAVGSLIVGVDAGDRRLVDRHVVLAASYGVATRPVLRRDEPGPFEGITAKVVQGVFVEGDEWVDPDEALDVVRRANEALGVQYLSDVVRTAAGGGDGVVARTDTGELHARIGLVATGAQGLPIGLHAPAGESVRPVRGMTVRLLGPDRSHLPMVRAHVHGRPAYYVGRADGYGVLGASSDESGELVVELGEFQRLVRDGLELFPALEAATLLETRVGLRPASADLRPFLCDLGGGWLWSSGHYRHGVTLAPLAARRLIDRVGAP